MAVQSRVLIDVLQGERPIENCQAYHFRTRYVWTVCFAAGCEKQSARGVHCAVFFPFATQHISRLVGFGMNVRGDSSPSVKFSQHRHAAGGSIPAQDF